MGACENRHTEVAKRLLAGADVEICVIEDVAELPIKAGADFNKTGEVCTSTLLFMRLYIGSFSTEQPFFWRRVKGQTQTS